MTQVTVLPAGASTGIIKCKYCNWTIKKGERREMPDPLDRKKKINPEGWEALNAHQALRHPFEGL